MNICSIHLKQLSTSWSLTKKSHFLGEEHRKPILPAVLGSAQSLPSLRIDALARKVGIVRGKDQRPRTVKRLENWFSYFFAVLTADTKASKFAEVS
jgi:hypothetical protein